MKVPLICILKQGIQGSWYQQECGPQNTPGLNWGITGIKGLYHDEMVDIHHESIKEKYVEQVVIHIYQYPSKNSFY